MFGAHDRAFIWHGRA